MRVGPPRINLAMFPQTAHASSIKLGLLMLLNLPGWHLQGRKCVWIRLLIDCFAILQMILKRFLEPLRAKKRAIYFSYRQLTNHGFLSSQLAWKRVKTNLGVGVLAQDSIIVIALNLTGWHVQVRRCVWNRIFLIVRDEN